MISPKDIINVLMQDQQLSFSRLGTFTLVNQPALVSPIEQKITPPAKKITFNANLKIDDGRLSRYLQEKYSLSSADAEKSIAAYEEGILGQLTAGALVKIEGFGQLSLDHKGEIRFNTAPRNFDKATFGLPTVGLEPIVRAERTPPAATTASPAANPALTHSSVPPVTSVKEHAKDSPLALAWLFLQQHVWYVVTATAVVVVLGLLYLNQRNQAPPPPTLADRPVVENNTARERVNVAPPPRQPQRERPSSTAEVITPPAAVNPPPPVNVPPADPALDVAIIAVGRYGQSRNVNKMIRRIEQAGYEPYSKRENGLTRVGIRYEYQNENQLNRALADIRRKFTNDAFIIRD